MILNASAENGALSLALRRSLVLAVGVDALTGGTSSGDGR